jgi:phage terminase large subunit
MQWPPNYTEVFKEREARYIQVYQDASLQYGCLQYYRTRPVEFINDWGMTYDPRNVFEENLPVMLPFILFPRQKELITFLLSCLSDRENGLVEKSRDMGATWVCIGFSVWLWLFYPGAAIGWGSRKEQLVDKLGDPDSIFEKIRVFIQHLPFWFKPKGFDDRKHFSFMRIVNPENGNVITGEAGDNIGRGGRKLIYFKDEAAHYEHPEKIEAALSDNTDVQIDFSSVNGNGNIFHRRRLSGVIWAPKREMPKGFVRVMILDWRDHPAKDQAWYNRRREKAEREGLLHVFNQEVDRDYSSSVEGLLIPGAWVRAAIDAHFKVSVSLHGRHYAGFDPFDEAMDCHALVARKGAVITYADRWSKGDTGQATRKVIMVCKEKKIDNLQYDGVGIGAGVKSEVNRLRAEGLLSERFEVQAWLGGNKVLFPKKTIIPDDPESIRNEDFYKNLKAQGWWQLRLRFERTYKAVTQGELYPPEDLISLPSTLPYLTDLENELSQPTYSHDSSGKIIINKKPPGTKSPNLGDAAVMAYWPVFDLPLTCAVVGGPANVGATRNLDPEKEAA